MSLFQENVLFSSLAKERTVTQKLRTRIEYLEERLRDAVHEITSTSQKCFKAERRLAAERAAFTIEHVIVAQQKLDEIEKEIGRKKGEKTRAEYEKETELLMRLLADTRTAQTEANNRLKVNENRTVEVEEHVTLLHDIIKQQSAAKARILSEKNAPRSVIVCETKLQVVRASTHFLKSYFRGLGDMVNAVSVKIKNLSQRITDAVMKIDKEMLRSTDLISRLLGAIRDFTDNTVARFKTYRSKHPLKRLFPPLPKIDENTSSFVWTETFEDKLAAVSDWFDHFVSIDPADSTNMKGNNNNSRNIRFRSLNRKESLQYEGASVCVGTRDNIDTTMDFNMNFDTAAASSNTVAFRDSQIQTAPTVKYPRLVAPGSYLRKYTQTFNEVCQKATQATAKCSDKRSGIEKTSISVATVALQGVQEATSTSTTFTLQASEKASEAYSYKYVCEEEDEEGGRTPQEVLAFKTQIMRFHIKEADALRDEISCLKTVSPPPLPVKTTPARSGGGGGAPAPPPAAN